MSKYSWQPKTEAQRAALDSRADILFFGGSIGSLKTATLLMDASQEYENPKLRGIIFRSSYQEMTDLVDKTREMYPPLGGEFVGPPQWTWTFKSGAKIRFAYMKTDADVFKYLGPRYSFIGADESTFHTEKQIRNIMGRLSSTDRNLRLRVRLCSNPGQVGADWHQKVFLRGQCPIHNESMPPEERLVPGKLYWDRQWPSDGEPIPFSVAFIPGKLSDHNLLDPDYAKRAAGMTGANAAQYGLGCWCKIEGRYFPFLSDTMVRPLAECGIEPWHNHFVAADYGYGSSYSAAGLYVRTPPQSPKKIFIPGLKTPEPEPQRYPNGRIRQIGEICEPMMPVKEFGEKIVENFIAPLGDEQRRSIIAIYLDPQNFNPSYDIRQGTGGHSISDQLDEVFDPWGLTCQPGSNSRAPGWQLIYRMLKDGEFEFTEHAPRTFEAIRTRMINPDKTADLLKVAGDPLDDLSDQLRYALYTFINPADKPRELVLKEATADIDITTREGLTSAAIRYQQAADRIDAEEAPIRFSSRRMGLGRRR